MKATIHDIPRFEFLLDREPILALVELRLNSDLRVVPVVERRNAD